MNEESKDTLRPQRNESRKNLILLISTVTIGLVFCEVVLRWGAGYETRAKWYYRCANIIFSDPNAAKYDPLLGFRFLPNLDFQFETMQFSVPVQTNSRGFRDDEESLVHPEFLFVGDSFTFGWGVEEENCWVSLVEDSIDRKCLNMGVPGYNTIQETLLFEQLIESLHGPNQKVVLTVFENDFKDNSTPVYSWFPTLRKKGTQLVVTDPIEDCYRYTQEANRPSFPKSVSRHSILAFLAWSVVDSATSGTLPDDEAPIDITFEKYGTGMNEFETFEYAIRYFKVLLDEYGLPLYTIYMPGRGLEIWTDCPYPGAFSEVMKKLEIPHIDLTPHLKEEDFFSIDGHLNEEGNRVAASVIENFLHTEGALEAPHTHAATPTLESLVSQN